MNFQRVVLTLALILFVVSLMVVAYTMYKQVRNEEWPPNISTCPDYFVDLSPEQNGSMCYNPHRIGKCNIPSAGNKNVMNFNVAPYNDPTNGKCAKYRWTYACGAPWSGISSGDCTTEPAPATS